MSDLNLFQAEAARHPHSVAITAGAGTGKTHVLAERFHFLLERNNWSPLNVVAITFTDKAADEMRARIRETAIEKNADADVIAEIDAAQISTIHSLAQRICRDFHDLAGIPADFRLMDENESTLWTMSNLEEAIGETCETEACEFGYSFLLAALKQMLSDPFAMEQALNVCSSEVWTRTIANSKAEAFRSFCEELGSADCTKRLREISGADGDTREILRRSVLNWIDELAAGDATAAEPLAQFGLQGGTAHNWPTGQFAEAKDLLDEIRKKAKIYLPKSDLEFGPLDEQLLAKVKLLARAFEKVRDHLAAAKLVERYLDFNDLEHYALKVLEHPEVVEHYRERWKAFLVDEVQDTNPIQFKLLSLLTSKANLTVVGDEKQAIYGFRGADVEVFRRFRERIEASEGGKTVVLKQTYRSSSRLAAAANRLFKPVLGTLHQDLRSDREYPSQDAPAPVRLAHVDSKDFAKDRKQNVEARRVAAVVGEMISSRVPVYDKKIKAYRPAEFRDFAVLSRTWDALETYGDAFAEAGIPAVNAGGGSLVKAREFKDAYCLLTFLADQVDDLSLACVLRSPFFAVSDRALYRFAAGLEPKTSWWPALREAEDLDPPLASARDCLARLIRERSHHSPEGLLRLAARETGYAAVAANLPHGRRREADWEGTLQFVRGLQEKGWEDLFSIVRYLRLAVRSNLDVKRPTVESGDAVSMMTIHAAKGLEWPVVFVTDLSRKFKSDDNPLVIDAEAGVAFTWNDADGNEVEPAIYSAIAQKCADRADAERRRMLYVAITRAGDFVHLSSAEPKGYSLDMLMPGLIAAGVEAESIGFDEAETLPPAPGEPTPFPELPADVHPVNVSTESVMATGLSTYALCPRKYKFQFVDGHPGLGEGAASAAAIGTLAHLALEMDIHDPEPLKLHGGCTDDELVEKALQQARNYRENDAFAAVRDLPAEKELRFNANVGGIRLYGIADLVGEDFVLDYKTDAVPDPEKHSIQLWSYARALGKPKAYIAYLRHDQLHELTSEDLARLDGVGVEMIGQLRAGNFEPAASDHACSRCTYTAICTGYSGSTTENA